jgi:prepilin-type N-terminal cleavage/methylation domain-containing protein
MTRYPLKRPFRARRSTQGGFSLIELMIAIVVSGIVLTGVFAFSSIQQTTAVIHRRHVRVQQGLEGAMHTISRDVRMAGLGFGRTCSELRIFDGENARLINPGSGDAGDLGATPVDAVTDEPFWVLRDGLQAFWRSADADDIVGDEATSASVNSMADAFDVILGERNFTVGTGLFAYADNDATGGDAKLGFKTSAALDSGTDLEAVQQLFPPGSFFLMLPPTSDAQSEIFQPEVQRQCPVLQVTGEIEAGDDANSFKIPIANTSGFNQDLDILLGTNDVAVPADAADGNPGDDWQAGLMTASAIVPLGRLRWSRYEIDYTQPLRPYLVRSDIIGVGPKSPNDVPVGNAYPGCPGDCPMPALHLPTADEPAPRTAVAPMIEDMQVAVGCDGYANPDGLFGDVQNPEDGFAEKGPKTGGGGDGNANGQVDEWNFDGIEDRGSDEWLGNAAEETWAPDCVYWGTGERNPADWVASGIASETAVTPAYRMSPTAIRVSLLGKAETQTAGGDALVDDFYNKLFPLEDRPETDTVIGAREYQLLTERFSPRNLRWRSPDML